MYIKQLFVMKPMLVNTHHTETQPQRTVIDLTNTLTERKRINMPSGDMFMMIDTEKSEQHVKNQLMNLFADTLLELCNNDHDKLNRMFGNDPVFEAFV